MLGYPADSRDYSLAASLLQDLRITSVRLLTNNPKKITALTNAGIVLVQRVPLELPAGVHNKVYMQTKKEKLGHLFDHV